MEHLVRIKAAVLPLALSALAACAAPSGTARVHPERLTAPPVCTACHDGDLSRLDHGPGFFRGHGDVARQEAARCDLCHRPSSCADCHGLKEEIRPSDKRKLQPGGFAPHPGDYLTQHRIDGRLNPVPCFDCHGRKGDRRCRTCHR